MPAPFLAVLLLAAAALPETKKEGEWQVLDQVQYRSGSHSDGDSIEVVHAGRNWIFRLYSVDTLEKNPVSRERRAGQAAEFGLPAGDDGAALRLAYAASERTRALLEGKPFSVLTMWEPVSRSGGNPSVRAAIRTADGSDLAEILVREGLAIIREGAVPDGPGGRSRSENLRGLRGAEDAAKAGRLGGWARPIRRTPPANRKALPASETARLVALAGEKAKVSGVVSRVGAMRNGAITFVNFAGNSREDFVAIIRKAQLPAFERAFPRGIAASLSGQAIVVEGLVTLYRGAPQIELTSPRQLKVGSGADASGSPWPMERE